MSIKAWPFLVSRNAVFDYRVVVAPQYMIDNKITSLLAKAAGGDATEPTTVIHREVYHPNPEIGTSSLIFRIIEANTQHIGLEGNELLKDQFGRPIRLIEGFVVRGQLLDPDSIVITEGDLLDALRSMQKDYQEFWLETTGTPIVRSSTESLDLPLDDLSRKSGTEKILKLHTIPAYVVRPKASTGDLATIRTDLVTASPPKSPPLPTLTKTKEQWVDEGDLLASGGYYEEALKTYNQALQLPCINHRDDAPVHRGKGDVFYYKGDYQRANQEYDEALKCDDSYALAYNGKGLISYTKRDYTHAINYYERAIQLDPNCALAHANKGFVLRNKKNDGIDIQAAEIRKAFEDAIEAYDRLLQNEKKAIWYYYKSLALMELPNREYDVKIAEREAKKLGYKRKWLPDIPKFF